MFFGGTYATNPLAITVLQQLQFSQKYTLYLNMDLRPCILGYNVRKSLDLCRKFDYFLYFHVLLLNTHYVYTKYFHPKFKLCNCV